MTEQRDLSRPGKAVDPQWPEIVRQVRARTPARLLAGRAGSSYRTTTQLELRAAHAAARDAVRAELNLATDFDAGLVEKWRLFEVCTQAQSKDEYLLRPDLGRDFDDEARTAIGRHCSYDKDLQIVVGDGLSVTAVRVQVPTLLELLCGRAHTLGWSLGQTIVVRHCRVGILNQIGELLAPRVAILLIGERPGLATAESLSAYMAYRPGKTQTDADRNLISNIHGRGMSTAEAAERIMNLAARMMASAASGWSLREELPVQPQRELK